MRKFGPTKKLVVVTFILFTIAGCGTLRNGRGWGQDAIYPLDLKRIPRAAYHACIDLQTLIPLAGALAVTPFDHRVSDWASTHTPIFGSKSSAENATDSLRVPLQVEALLTALTTPSGDNAKDWLYSKAKGIGVEWLSERATGNATSFIKKQTGRTRPNRSDNQSLPSSGASSAFNYSTLANLNLDAIPMPSKVRIPLQVGNILLASSVAWARIEAKDHYPSDVLVGAALGHFVTAFLYEAFMGLPEDRRFGFAISPLRGGAMAELFFAF
jgi:hypothetical protein